MPAYFVAVKIAVNDPKEMEIYSAKAKPSLQGHPLDIKAFYGKLRNTDGSLPVEGAVIFEFPTFKDAEAWYDSPAYQEAVVHRLKGSTYTTFIVEGV